MPGPRTYTNYATTGSVSGGTPDFIARWLDAVTLGTGQMRDDATTVGVGGAPPGADALMRVYGTLAMQFLQSQGAGTPTIVAGGGAGVATGGVASIVGNGTDFCGVIRVDTGTAPINGQIIATITFSAVLPRTPYVMATAGGFTNNTSLATQAGVQVANVSATSWDLRQNSNLGASLTFFWTYFVIDHF